MYAGGGKIMWRKRFKCNWSISAINLIKLELRDKQIYFRNEDPFRWWGELSII